MRGELMRAGARDFKKEVGNAGETLPSKMKGGEDFKRRAALQVFGKGYCRVKRRASGEVLLERGEEAGGGTSKKGCPVGFGEGCTGQRGDAKGENRKFKKAALSDLGRG